MSESAEGPKNDRPMAGDKAKGQRLETLTSGWTRPSPDPGATPGHPGTTLARIVSTRLQTLYPAAAVGDESEALRRLMAELATKDL